MNDSDKPKSATSCTTSQSLTFDEMNELMRGLENKQLLMLKGLCEGVPVIPDVTGLLVPCNGYAVIVGARLYDKLKKT